MNLFGKEKTKNFNFVFPPKVVGFESATQKGHTKDVEYIFYNYSIDKSGA